MQSTILNLQNLMKIRERIKDINDAVFEIRKFSLKLHYVTTINEKEFIVEIMGKKEERLPRGMKPFAF